MLPGTRQPRGQAYMVRGRHNARQINLQEVSLEYPRKEEQRVSCTDFPS